jgi:hypothetical protein
MATTMPVPLYSSRTRPTEIDAPALSRARASAGSTRLSSPRGKFSWTEASTRSWRLGSPRRKNPNTPTATNSSGKIEKKAE